MLEAFFFFLKKKGGRRKYLWRLCKCSAVEEEECTGVLNAGVFFIFIFMFLA